MHMVLNDEMDSHHTVETTKQRFIFYFVFTPGF